MDKGPRFMNKNPQKKALYLVDASNLLFRSYHALPPLTNSKGLHTHALLGFLNMSLKLLKEPDPRGLRPFLMAYCFDRHEDSFRKKISPLYKANRGETPEELLEQIPYVRPLIEALGIATLDKKGFEADDIISTLSTWGEKAGLDVVIVSGDKDFAQLVSGGVFLYDTMKNLSYGPKEVFDKWGVTPEQFVDYQSLVGDSSDNIAGVKGIGPKGAQKLLKQYKSLAGLWQGLDAMPESSTKTKLQNGRASALEAQKLVQLQKNLNLKIDPLKDLALKPMQEKNLLPLLKKLEFQSHIKKLNLSQNATHPPEPATLKERPPLWSMDQIRKNLPTKGSVWIFKDNTDWVLGGWAPEQKNKACRVSDSSHVKEQLGAVFLEKDIAIKTFDIKALWHNLKIPKPLRAGCDLMLLAYILEGKEIKTLDQICKLYLGQGLPPNPSGFVCLQQALLLEPLLTDKLKQRQTLDIYQFLELPLVPVLYSIELSGVLIDPKELKNQEDQLQKRLHILEKEITTSIGLEFNINSPKQLSHALFEHLKLPPTKKTKTQAFSTHSSVLQELKTKHAAIALIIEHRELSKLLSTYIKALPQFADPHTHRVRTCFKQALTTTGRLSSTEPNLQNIPIRTALGRDIRKAFIAPPKKHLLCVDYSQIELRVLAHITKDPGLCMAFDSGQDIHASTAAAIFQKQVSSVTPEQRRIAKGVNFGIVYGQGAFGLAKSLGISKARAKELIEGYFSKFPGIRVYIEDTLDFAKKHLFVENMFGRRRPLPDLASSNHARRSFAQRAAVNMPIQSAASDIVKKAMLLLFDQTTVPMVLQVHDELLFELGTTENSEIQKIVNLMESAANLHVPLKCQHFVGNNWFEAH